MEEYENNSQTEILEERLKLIEAELQDALQRAEKAEKALAPPAPPLPPPPPPLLADFATTPPPPSVPLRTKKLSRSNVPEIAATLGVQQETNDCSSSKKPAIGKILITILNKLNVLFVFC